MTILLLLKSAQTAEKRRRNPSFGFVKLSTAGSPFTARAGPAVPPGTHRGHYRSRVFLGRLRPFPNRFCSFQVPYAERGHFLTYSLEKIIKNDPGTFSNGSDRARFGTCSRPKTSARSHHADQRNALRNAPVQASFSARNGPISTIEAAMKSPLPPLSSGTHLWGGSLTKLADFPPSGPGGASIFPRTPRRCGHFRPWQT